MRIKIGDDYLEYEGDIEIEKKIKLFEDIEATEGDFSYQFEVFLTAKNIRLLGIPFADNSRKLVYNNIDCQLLGEDGLPIYKGYIRVEGIKDDFALCSFFSGNTTWLSMITGNLSDLDYSKYDVVLNNANIQNTWNDTSGLVMPVVDSGVVSYRSYRDLVVEDFKGFLFIKEVMRDIFQSVGIKLTGELLNDYRYNNLIFTSNDLSDDEIKKRSTYANKTSNQALVISTPTKILFQDDSTYPFFDGSLDNYDNSISRYSPDVQMYVKVDLNAIFTFSGGLIGAVSFSIYKNGVQEKVIALGIGLNTTDNANGSFTIKINSSDYLEIYAVFDAVVGTPALTIDQGSTLRITPIYLYQVFGNSILPKWSKRQFINNVFKIFCPIIEFQKTTNTLTVNLFENIKEKNPVDLSEYISETEVDYADFINDYGRSNILSYTESDVEVIGPDGRDIGSEEAYNNSNNISYGAGNIEVNNDFIEETVDLLESDFSAPFTYMNPAFDMSFEKMDLVEQNENSEIEVEITSVTDTGDGLARFNVPTDVYSTGDLVKIENSTIDSYNGYWVVFIVGAGYFYCGNVVYNGNATADSVKMDLSLTKNGSTYILLKSRQIDMGDYLSSNNELYIGGFFTYSDFSVGYFNMIDNNKEATNKLRLGLSFGRSSNDLQFQVPLIESYWDLVGRILNDPVKLICTANIPEKIFRNISFLNPVIIRTKETSNMYYLNRITGYKGSHLPCTLELIKLP